MPQRLTRYAHRGIFTLAVLLLGGCATKSMVATTPPVDCAQASQRINTVAVASGELHKELTAKKNIPGSSASKHLLVNLASGDASAQARLKELRTAYYDLRYYARSNKCRLAKLLPSFEDLRSDIIKHPTRYYGHTPDIRKQVGAPASTASVRLLMQKMGAAELATQMLTQLLPAMKKLAPDTSEEFWKKSIGSLDTDEMIDQMIPVYQKYLSEKDVQQMNSFYDSDTGKKLLQVQPQIMKETMILGQEWGRKKTQEILKKLRSKKANDRKLESYSFDIKEEPKT